MRVIWWTPGFPPDVGGMERLAALVVPELARRDVDVMVVANTDDHEISESAYCGVPVTRLPSRRALAARDLRLIAASTRRVAQLKEQFQPDLVHVHFSDPSVHLHLTTATPATRTVLTLHNSLASAVREHTDGSLFARAVARADAITGVSESVLPPTLRDTASRDGRLITVIPNGVVVGDDPGPPPSPPSVLAVGRLIPAKGFDVLLRAFARSHAHTRGIELRLVGGGSERDTLEALAAELGVAVTFTGELSPAAVGDEYRRASLVVMPSRREGNPLVAIEAAAAGRPVLASDIPAMREVVQDGTTGVLVRGDDPDAFAHALDQLLEDPTKRGALGTAARRRAVADFSLDVCVERHLALYRAVLDRDPIA
jgi:glycosyltransferase involved in cell wall biosynthesis